MKDIIFKTLMLKGEAGSTIVSMERTGHSGTTDTYTITFDDGSTTDIQIENLSSVESIELTSQTDTEDTYTATLADGSTQSFSVLNHNADIEAISEELAAGLASIAADLADQAALLSARMDEFTSLPSGSTSGDAELMDIRVGADGKTYESAGSAVRGQVTDLKREISVLSEYNSANILQQYGTFNNSTSNGVTIAWDSKHEKCTLTGTATGYANFNLITANTAFPSWLKKNKKYALLISNSDPTNVKIQLLTYVNGSSSTLNISNSAAISFDDDVTGIILRIRADNNSATYNANVSVRMFERPFEIESTNDTTDRTTDIYAMLQAFSVCKLGSGLFYTSGITMADGTTLEGCGNDTILRLKDESTIAVRLGKRCFVNRIKFVGADTRQGGGDTIGTRNGIYYTASISAEEDEQFSCVSQCSFIGFSGAGIQVYSIGHNMLHSISVDQCKFKYNKVGLYLNNLVEFAMVSNCAFNHNYFGSICNGGNNKYVNCNFDGNSKGFVINGSGGAENIGHGSVVGCSFNHNTIVGINIISNANGMIFDACCIYHNKTSQDVDNSIAIDSSVGTHFSNCLMGATDGVSITDASSQGTMLIGCRFVQATSIPTSVIKANCYLLDGAAI